MTIAGEPHLGPQCGSFALPAGASAKRSAMDEQPLQEPWNSHSSLNLYIKEAEKHLAEMPAFL